MKGQMRTNRWIIVGMAALALASVAVPTSAGQRALSDFTSRQGTWCMVFTAPGPPDCAASYYLDVGPPCVGDDRINLLFGQFWSDPKHGLYALIDVLGDLDAGDFGTIVTGSIAENRIPNGLADVKVLVHTSNALTRAFDLASGEPVFGHAYFEVLEGAQPTLGDADLQITFTNTAPGAPLPDFNQLLSCPAPGQALEITSMRARANGPLRAAFGVPDGAPGRFEMVQTGLIGTAALVDAHSRVALDAFPAEYIIIRATGK